MSIVRWIISPYVNPDDTLSHDCRSWGYLWPEFSRHVVFDFWIDPIGIIAIESPPRSSGAPYPYLLVKYFKIFCSFARNELARIRLKSTCKTQATKLTSSHDMSVFKSTTNQVIALFTILIRQCLNDKRSRHGTTLAATLLLQSDLWLKRQSN